MHVLVCDSYIPASMVLRICANVEEEAAKFDTEAAQMEYLSVSAVPNAPLPIKACGI